MRLNNITKKFKDKVVFENFSCEITDNAITSLTGPSGSGKTTLLRILASLDTDYTGIYTGKTENISFAFQEPLLFGGATVLENTNISGKDAYAAKDMLCKLGISENDFGLYPRSLSGGMAKRVSLARALLYNAELYLIDEPFAGLDDCTKALTQKIMLEALKGKTAVISTHDADLAKMLEYNIRL